MESCEQPSLTLYKTLAFTHRILYSMKADRNVQTNIDDIRKKLSKILVVRQKKETRRWQTSE